MTVLTTNGLCREMRIFPDEVGLKSPVTVCAQRWLTGLAPDRIAPACPSPLHPVFLSALSPRAQWMKLGPTLFLSHAPQRPYRSPVTKRQGIGPHPLCARACLSRLQRPLPLPANDASPASFAIMAAWSLSLLMLRRSGLPLVSGCAVPLLDWLSLLRHLFSQPPALLIELFRSYSSLARTVHAPKYACERVPADSASWPLPACTGTCDPSCPTVLPGLPRPPLVPIGASSTGSRPQCSAPSYSRPRPSPSLLHGTGGRLTTMPPSFSWFAPASWAWTAGAASTRISKDRLQKTGSRPMGLTRRQGQGRGQAALTREANWSHAQEASRASREGSREAFMLVAVQAPLMVLMLPVWRPHT